MTKLTLTVNEAAQLVGVSIATIYTMARQGEIPHVRVRGRILFHREKLEQWLRGELEATRA
ncbi:helix-turn-helix domain-containing protein [Paenibacillus sp. YIM B09110]|uniref:helix-turn-helix domain-containing protein n=1 Tax=Paenibacillus sp. YIM B09110 TaxID=3126102 RepID=UPI00301CEAC3